jgi:nucleoside 2-deoxyribosyltransferase
MAGPIDQVGSMEALVWRDHLSIILARYGYGTFSPAHAYRNVERTLHADAVLAINNTAIVSCDNIFVNFSGPTIGSVREMEYASRLGKSVYLYTTNNTMRKTLQASFATIDCHILTESMLGDAVAEMVKAILVRETTQQIHDRVESEEDER